MKFELQRWKASRIGHNCLMTRAKMHSGLIRIVVFALAFLFVRCGARSETNGFHPSRILVKPRQGAVIPMAGKLLTGSQVRSQYMHLGGMQVIQIPSDMTVHEAMNRMQQSGFYEYAEPDYLLRAAGSNDPYYEEGTLWGLDNTGKRGGVSGMDISAASGWKIRSSAENVVVAVIDSGIRYTHSDLAANMWINSKEIADNNIDDDGNGYIDDVYGINVINSSGNPMDDYGHGTTVAGIIGAVGNNSIGTCGVTWKVRLMALKFLDSRGEGTVSDAIRCISYAYENGAAIINASWGDTERSQALADAIEKTRQYGILFVTAAGNSEYSRGGDDVESFPMYPGSFDMDNIVVVTAINRSGQLANYANYGAKTVDIAAPGWEIFSTSYAGDNQYTSANGTSMATAFVSGILALAKAEFPHENHLQIIGRLMANVKPLSALNNKCVSGGLANLRNILGPALVASFQPSAIEGAVPLKVNFVNNSVGQSAQATWNFGDGTPESTEWNPNHTYMTEGSYTVALTILDSLGTSIVETQTINAVANYVAFPTNYTWLDLQSELIPLRLGDDSVTPALALPFSFSFYGQQYKHIHISANGIIGFDPTGMEQKENKSFAGNPGIKNAFAPYWDDLDPSAGGQINWGVIGLAPQRQLVISWIQVPRFSSPEIPISFQVALSEGTGIIQCNYKELWPDNVLGGARAATIGAINAQGSVALNFIHNGVPQILSNRSSMAFISQNQAGLVIAPSSDIRFRMRQNGPVPANSISMVISNMALFTSYWTLEKNQPWLDISSTGGILQPMETAVVKVGINDRALLLQANTYAAELQLDSVNGYGDSTQRIELFISMPGPARLIPPVFPNLFPFAIILDADPAVSYRIERSSDLKSWSGLGTGTYVVPESGQLIIVDPQALLSPQQFYRAVESVQ